jgi:hypothetical protein
MSIFSKPLSQLGTADLQELMQEQAVENLRLEFKFEIPEKDEMLKKLSAFANTFGGLMVVGASASSKDGRLTDLPGVEKTSGFKQKVVDWCFKGVSPPLEVDVSDPISTPSGNGKFVYVIKMAESDVAPHFMSGRKGVWVRTNEFSGRTELQLADEHELRHLFDRRRLILERREALLQRARKRYDALADKTNTDLGGTRTKLGSRLELAIVPRFPASPLCKQEDLKSLVQRNTLIWRQVRFPNVENGILTQQESAIVLGAAHEDYSIFEANIWGMLFYGTRIDDNLGYLLTGEPDPSEPPGIHIYQFTGYVLAFLQHASKMLRDLGYSGPLHIHTRLTSIRHIEWLDFPHEIPSRQKGSELDDTVEFEISSASEDLREKPNDVVMNVLRYVLFSVNAAEQAETAQKLEELVRLGYRYNAWSNSV